MRNFIGMMRLLSHSALPRRRPTRSLRNRLREDLGLSARHSSRSPADDRVPFTNAEGWLRRASAYPRRCDQIVLIAYLIAACGLLYAFIAACLRHYDAALLLGLSSAAGLFAWERWLSPKRRLRSTVSIEDTDAPNNDPMRRTSPRQHHTEQSPQIW